MKNDQGYAVFIISNEDNIEFFEASSLEPSAFAKTSKDIFVVIYDFEKNEHITHGSHSRENDDSWLENLVFLLRTRRSIQHVINQKEGEKVLAINIRNQEIKPAMIVECNSHGRLILTYHLKIGDSIIFIKEDEMMIDNEYIEQEDYILGSYI